MSRSLIRVWCISGMVAACTDGSPSVTEVSPPPASGAPSLPAEQSTNNSLAGTLAFVSRREGEPHIYLSNPDGSDVRRLTNALKQEVTPVWSPDGRQLAFVSDGAPYVIKRDGTGLIRIPIDGVWPSWSPDGKRLLVATQNGLSIVAADGSMGIDGAIEVSRNGSGAFSSDVEAPQGARWSPDGTRIAFNSWTGFDFTRSFIMNVNGSGMRSFVGPVNNAIWDECGPVWSPDGTRIALLGGVFGGIQGIVGIFAVGIVDIESGRVTPIAVTGTTCWDNSYSSMNSFSGVAWSPDQKSLAITERTPSWNTQPGWMGVKASTISIIDITNRARLAEIPDAYDPAWAAPLTKN